MMTRAGMARHLGSCEVRAKRVAEADARPGPESVQFHLQVWDAWSGDYWLHVEIDGATSLGHLDSYLRAIWLECCGHASQFSLGRWSGERFGMTRKVHQVFQSVAEITHIYDFGTESLTLIKAIAERRSKATGKRPIALMARNALPEALCQECDAVASSLCIECTMDGDRSGLLCSEHGRSHPHEDYGEPVPVVNSPRMGVCGYTGPAEPPY
jgi:hypothetical protein